MEDKKYLNPLKVNNSKENNKAPDSHADPYVIKYNGEYYCYSTHGSGVPVFHSRDLTEWEYIGFALQTEGEKSFWAPAVIYNNGLFYMYYSSIKNEEDDVHREFMKVAVSKRPEGPFIYQKTLFDNFSIDAHVTRDFKGDYYLYYTVSSHSGIDGQKPGTVLLVDRLTDMMTLEGKPQVAVMPTLEEEIFEKNRFGDGRDWYCVEGPFHLTRNGREYLMFSGNAFTSHYYFVGYSVKDEKGQWHKFPNDYTYYPIIRKNEKVEGTGHNSVVRGPNNTEQWFVYHGRNIREIEDENGKMVKDKRVMRMDPLYWIGDKMWVDGPSYEERPAPFQPAFQDFFDGANGELLSDNWEVLDGSWNCLDGQLVQNDLKKNASAIADIKSCCYVMEISLKWNYSFMGGQYGVYAVYIDSKNYVQVMLDVGKKELAALEILGGVKVREFRVDLEKDFDFESYHHMRICRTGGSCQIFIDDVQKIDGRFTEKAGRVGLFTKFTSACFDGMAVTNHLELYKGSEIEFIKAVKAEIKENDECWAVRDGSLICQSGSYDRLNEIILHNPCCNEYSLSVETKLQTQSGKGMLGVHLAYKDQENRISFILDNRSLTLSLICRQEGIDKVLCEQGLPDDMKLDDTHCISAIILNKKITVRLDKYLIYIGEAACLAEGIGLFCIGDASFSALQLTGI